MAAIPRPPLSSRRTLRALRRLGPRTRALTGVVVFALAVALPGTVTDLSGPTMVTLNGHSAAVAGEPTVGRLLDDDDVDLEAGRLLSLEGDVLNAGAFPPSITRNGAPADVATLLRAGDVVDVRNGADATEPFDVLTYGRGSGNPQFIVGSGTVTVRRGRISGEVEPIAATGGGPAQVALTFDDGPSPRFTPAILAVLQREGVKATFFEIGGAAFRYPQVVRAVLAAGMPVEDHTWSHLALARKPAPVVRDQVGHTRDFLDSLGAHVTLVRPPYGRFDPGTVALAASLGLRTVVWTIDSKDWKRPGTAAIVQRAVNGAYPGAIILMHDGGGDRSQTLAALPAIIHALKARGYAFVTLG